MSDLEDPWEIRYNKQAHQNCIAKLNQANERIVEFEEIKKDLLKKLEDQEKFWLSRMDSAHKYNKKIKEKSVYLEEALESANAMLLHAAQEYHDDPCLKAFYKCKEVLKKHKGEA